MPSLKSPLPKIKEFVSSLKPEALSTDKDAVEINPRTKRRRDSIRDVLRGKYGIHIATEVVPVYVPEKGGVGRNWQLRWGSNDRRPSEAVYDGFEYYKSKSISGPARRKTYLTTGY